jgi:hypothetical protein
MVTKVGHRMVTGTEMNMRVALAWLARIVAKATLIRAASTKKPHVDGGVSWRNIMIFKSKYGGYRWTRTTDLGIMSATL